MPLSRLSSFNSVGDLLGLLSEAVRRGGGRRPGKADQPSLDVDDDGDGDPNSPGKKSWLKPCGAGEARLTVVQITDVYTLDNFASLKTLLKTIRAAQGSSADGDRNRVISMLTGDFLSPYLLSSIDRGAGMMQALAETPVDYLMWGNHEADIDHRTACRHVRNFPGTWLNTNMQGHEAMKYQKPYEIIEVSSPDGTQKRKVGLVAVLSDDPKLYAHFKKPGAFGGAAIDDPWETLHKYKRILEEEHKCDVVLPLQHLYVPDDHKTCREFDFPVILSGHDHHRVDEMVDGTRLIKPGMDGVYATVLEMVWDSPDRPGNQPKIHSTFVETAKFDPCPALKQRTDRAYDVLLPLRNTELIGVLPTYEPLSSKNARGSLTTMGQFLCSLLKASLNQTREPGQSRIDAVILMGGNIRGGEDYPRGSFFSLEMLEAEIKSDEVVAVVPIPGDVLARGIEVTHAGDPIPGWFQYDDGIREAIMSEEGGGKKKRVTHVAGMPLDPHRTYCVATKISDLGNGQSPPLKQYFTDHPECLPSKGSYFNIQTELMGFFARNLFRKLWEATGEKIIPDLEEKLKEAAAASAACAGADNNNASKDDDDVAPPQQPADSTIKKVESGLRLEVLDRSGDGVVTVDEIHAALRDLLGLTVHDDNKTLAECVHSYADVTGSGVVTREDFEHFCKEMPTEYMPVRNKWDDAFPDPVVLDQSVVETTAGESADDGLFF